MVHVDDVGSKVPFRYHGVRLGETLWGEQDFVRGQHRAMCVKICGRVQRKDEKSFYKRL
jgi:hypothetical protein